MKSGLLRRTDLPATWSDTGKPPASVSSATQLTLAKSVPACKNFAVAVERENRRSKASSNRFVDTTAAPPSRSEVSNEVVAWTTIAEAKSAYAAYSAGVMKSCLQTVFRKIISQQAAASGLVPTITVDNLPTPKVGDAAVGYEAVVSIPAGAVPEQIAFIIEIVRVGRYTVSYNATLYKSAPTGFGKNLVVRSVARLEAAPSS